MHLKSLQNPNNNVRFSQVKLICCCSLGVKQHRTIEQNVANETMAAVVFL